MRRRAVRAIRSIIGMDELSTRVSALESAVRQAADVTSEASALSADATPAAPSEIAKSAPSLDVNYLLHHSRGALLRGMPPGAQHLLSAGCAGNWYFDWIEETYGRVPEHLGIEFYMPKPEALPDNVTWIANTASDMSAVSSASCDLVFSGQNLEHLWPEEVSGFLLESARVLKQGGHLVVDSPNRLLTAPLNWSHPEHTIELTLAEITALMRLAGFEITASYGIWLCRDARTGAVLPFDPNQPTPGWSITERLIVARDRPEDSFIWWVEGARSERAPDAAATHAMMDDLFRKYWPERVQRLVVAAGHGSRQSADGEWIESAAGQGGVTIYGPYMPLRAGRYRVTWQIQPAPGASSPVAVCDVVAGPDATVVARHEVQPGESRIALEFDLPDITFGLQFRTVSTGGAGFSVVRRIRLDEHLPKTTGPEGGSSTTLTIAGRSMRFTGNPVDPYFQNLNGFFSDLPALEPFVRKNLAGDAICLDVGANIGLTAILLSLLCPQGHVYAFEALPKNAAFLAKNLRINGIENCTVINCAVGAIPGHVEFTDSGAGSHVVTSAHLDKVNRKTVSVPMITLDDFVLFEMKLARVDFVKMDVEGFEPSALAGGRAFIERYRPPILMEFNTWSLAFAHGFSPFAFANALFTNFDASTIQPDGSLVPAAGGNVNGFLHDNMVVRHCVSDILLRLRPGSCVPELAGMVESKNMPRW
jgi:FkbM family methyltransferase